MNWKQELLEMKFSWMERRTPKYFASLGGRQMQVKTYSDHSNNDLIAAITDYFKYSGSRADRTGRDTITVMYKSRPATIKIDFSAGPLTKNQVEKNLVEIDKGIAFTVSSYPSFLTQWKTLKNKLDNLMSPIVANK